MAGDKSIGLLGWIGIPIAVAVALLVMLTIGSLVGVRLIGGDVFSITSSSMTPALVAGDWVLAPRLGRAVPERGTVVVFRPPKKPNLYWVERVIAFAGETVQMRGSVVYIDGQAAEMERIADRVIPMLPRGKPATSPRCKNADVARGEDCIQEQWRETLPDGTTQIVLNITGEVGVLPETRSITADNTQLVTVPEGHVFVLGDNRDNSVDSRYPTLGMIPIENLHYSAWIVHSSSNRAQNPWSLHFSRFFKRIE